MHIFPTSPPEQYDTSPAESEEISGAWSFKITNRPFVPGTSTLETRQSEMTFSGVRTFNAIWSHTGIGLSSDCSEHFLTLPYRLLNRTDIEEGLFRNVVHLSVEDKTEAPDGVLDRHHHSRHSGELFRHSKRL